MKTKKRHLKYPVIGQYLDTITGAKLAVTHFTDDIGKFELSTKDFAKVLFRGCRFQLKVSDVKRKRRFYNKLKTFLDIHTTMDFDEDYSEVNFAPLLFGLLKIRKNKARYFVLIQDAISFINIHFVDVVAVIVDNLTYLDLVNKSKQIDEEKI
jgi:hypothetical protein